MSISQKDWNNFKRELPTIIILSAIQIWGIFYLPGAQGSRPKWLGLSASGLVAYKIIMSVLLTAAIIFIFTRTQKLGYRLQSMDPFARKMSVMMPVASIALFAVIFWLFNPTKANAFIFANMFVMIALFYRAACRAEL